MSSLDVTYVGLRGRQPDYGHGGPVVVGVCRGDERRNLAPGADWLTEAEFEWGYEGAGPRRLAQAILNDFLERKADVILSNLFMRDVISHLPSDFELTGREIAAWMADQRATASGESRPDPSD